MVDQKSNKQKHGSIVQICLIVLACVAACSRGCTSIDNEATSEQNDGITTDAVSDEDNKDSSMLQTEHKSYTLEDLQELSADELLDLFIDNGLSIDERLTEYLSEEQIKEMLETELVTLVRGISSRGSLMYWDFAKSVKETYEKMSGESR